MGGAWRRYLARHTGGPEVGSHRYKYTISGEVMEWIEGKTAGEYGWQGRYWREPIKWALPAFDFKFQCTLPGSSVFFPFLKW